VGEKFWGLSLIKFVVFFSFPLKLWGKIRPRCNLWGEKNVLFREPEFRLFRSFPIGMYLLASALVGSVLTARDLLLWPTREDMWLVAERAGARQISALLDLDEWNC
jgi:hypothetical protein